MADGDWVFAGVVDAPGGGDQRDALTRIVSGEAGGTPGLIRKHLVSDFRGVRHEPISFSMDGHSRAVEIPNVLSFAIDGVLSRNDSGEPLYLDNTSHPANSRLALAQSRHTRINAFDLELDLEGRGTTGTSPRSTGWVESHVTPTGDCPRTPGFPEASFFER